MTCRECEFIVTRRSKWFPSPPRQGEPALSVARHATAATSRAFREQTKESLRSHRRRSSYDWYLFFSFLEQTPHSFRIYSLPREKERRCRRRRRRNCGGRERADTSISRSDQVHNNLDAHEWNIIASILTLYIKSQMDVCKALRTTVISVT